jgi:ABC-type nitrate/sulfonate/bicarbonate transport system permease component
MIVNSRPLILRQSVPGLSWPARIRQGLASPRFRWGIVGIGVFILYWYLLVDVFKLWNFARLPGFVSTVKEWTNREPVYGTSLFTAIYYKNILSSLQRVAVAFLLATTLGVTVGLLMGWRRVFYGLTFPILELLRPIPILAYIPVVLLLVPGREAPIIVLTFLAAFFVTILNTLLGVRSIDPSYFRAARSLGFSERAILQHVIVPGALPYVFVGLQIGMAACWFSLVASEIVSGQSGMGYQVWQTYYYQQYETMVIYMGTLGMMGWASCAMLRAVGNRMMRWRAMILGGI